MNAVLVRGRSNAVSNRRVAPCTGPRPPDIGAFGEHKSQVCPQINVINMPRIDHQMGRKARNRYGRPTLGSSVHAACFGGYAPAVRMIDHDTEKDRAARYRFDDFDRLHGRGRGLGQQSANRAQQLRPSGGDKRAIYSGRQRALRPTVRTALHTSLISGAAQKAAHFEYPKPAVAPATPGFFASPFEISGKGTS